MSHWCEVSVPARAGVGCRTARLLMRSGWAAIALMIAACAAPPPVLKTSPDFPEDPPAQRFVLEPGDEIEIKFRYWKDLNTEQIIRPDGKISLQAVGHVTAAGLSPEELDAKLVKLYARELKDPDITTIVLGMASQKIYVGGEVLKPGLIALGADMTVLEAVMTAGGYNKYSAEPSNVVVIRHRDGKRYARAYDLQAALDDPGPDAFRLAPRDIVFVPRTTIDRVNQWVDQYINRLLPRAALSFGLGEATLTVGGPL